MATLTIDFPRSAVTSVERMRSLTGVEPKATFNAAPVTKAGLLARLANWYRSRSEHADEMRTLSRFTDRQLMDIGMTRGDVWRMAR